VKYLKKYQKHQIKNIIELLKREKIGVLPTDTIYGLVGSAFSKKAVERIYEIKKRKKDKPLIILIPSPGDLKKFGIRPSKELIKFLKKIWPGPVSIIFPVKNKKFLYLQRKTNSLAFRMPNSEFLKGILLKTGPLAAPSANPEGKTPASTIGEAKTYFNKKVDFYLDAGKIIGKPSLLLELKRF